MFTDLGCIAATKINLDTMRNNISNAKTGIKYYTSCNNQPGECIDIFSDTQVQMLQAVALAQEYIKTKQNIDIICSATYRTDWNDDYIKCSDVTGSTNYYEFKFDDVKESTDSTIQQNVADALCKIHHGTYNNTCSLRNEYTNALKASIEKFGYNTVCNQYIGVNSNYSTCNILFNSKNSSDYKLKTAFGINPRKFINLQLQADADLKFLLKRYTKRQVESEGQTLTQFECANSFQIYETNDLFNAKDDIITCTANGEQIDFLFDDINENFDYQANAGTAGLTCIADSGGIFDGRNCNGLTYEQCIAMDNKIPGGTTWDIALDTCTLNDANTAANIDEFTEHLVNSGIATGFVTITILTGGSTIFIVAGIAGAAGTSISATVQNEKEKETREFIASSTRCKTSDCAETALNTFITNISYYHDDISGQLLDAVDEELARLFNLLPENSTTITDAIQQTKSQQNISNFANWPVTEQIGLASGVLTTIGAIGSINTGFKTGWSAIVNALKRRQPTPRTLHIIIDTIAAADGGNTTLSISQ